ncbi:MAG: hypothetical protein ABIS50_10765 [Luteolibacter sp.]|uniref:hypothetical protein n=1 Tax=Luteolibacter sp. TaxID=1962973 RepID=UPI003265684C
MFKKSLLIVLAGALAFSVPARAQTDNGATDPGTDTETTDPKKTGDSAGPQRFWQASLGGGNYMVALDRITSVSRHKYLLDGAVIVDEVTVDTVGQALARFYFMSPVTDAAPGNTVSDLANRGRELVDKAARRTGAEVQNMVVKKFPETTHAKSIEYRVLTEADLTALYASVKNAWETGRGRQFTVK